MLGQARFLLILLPAVCWACDRDPADSSTAKSTRVYFSPNGGITDALVELIGSAKATVDVQAYGFTSAPIAKAVADAHGRGVKVRVILDGSQRTNRYSSATYLSNHGVPVYIDDKHGVAHNKVMLVDGHTVVTGSFNFSKAAETDNAENMLIIRGDADLFREYQRNFDRHLAHAQPYTRPK